MNHDARHLNRRKHNLILAWTLLASHLCPRLSTLAWGQEATDRTTDNPMLAARPATWDRESTPLALASNEEREPQPAADPYSDRAYGIGGPWRLRSADALRPGQLSIRNEATWTTGYPTGDDETRYQLNIDYGFAPMHQVIFELPVAVGDGAVTGNGDFRLGWHWQWLKEADWTPSFAVRNYIRLPTGYESSGVDYELRGLFSKSVADHVRAHFAPYLLSANGDNVEDVRRFQWGAAIGSDWKATEALDLVLDYVMEASQVEGVRNQQSLDLGFIWEVAPNHKVGLNGRVGLDGDGVNGDWGAGVFYSISLDGLPFIGK